MHSAEPTRRLPAVEVAVREDLDAWSSERVHHTLQEALAAKPELLIIDLTHCPSMDDAGVALVLDTHRRAAQIDVTVALRSPSPWLKTTLQHTHGQVLQGIDTVTHELPRADAHLGQHATPAATSALMLATLHTDSAGRHIWP